MINFNDGDIHSFDDVIKNREIAVKQISEGNSSLEMLLNYCIDNNIPTQSSCGDFSPYITFILTEQNTEMIFSFCRFIGLTPSLKEAIKFDIDFCDGFSRCCFRMIDHSQKTMLFDLILDYFKKYNKTLTEEQEEFICARDLSEKTWSLGYYTCIDFKNNKSTSKEESDTHDYEISFEFVDSDREEELREIAPSIIPGAALDPNYPEFILSPIRYTVKDYGTLISINEYLNTLSLK